MGRSEASLDLGGPIESLTATLVNQPASEKCSMRWENRGALFALVAGSGTVLGVLVGGLFRVLAFVSSVVVFGMLALVFY